LQNACAKSLVHLRFASLAWIALVLLLPLAFKAERLPIKTYTVGDGLLRDRVSKIKQDSRGFLWFCTEEGISRFDGYAFTNLTPADGLPDRRVNDFLETKNGTILIATDSGLVRLNPTGIRNSTENPLFTILLPENERAKGFRVLFEDASGTVWAGTTDGLYKLNERFELEYAPTVEPLNRTDRLFINKIIKDRRGIMWIGTASSGLVRISPTGDIKRYSDANDLPYNNVVTVLFEDASGQIWANLRLGTTVGLVKIVAEPEPNRSIVERHYTTKDGLPHDYVTDLFESSDGKFWVATDLGLCEWQGDKGDSVCKVYKANNGLCDTELWSIAEDKDGNLWMGTRCGTKKWARYGFTTYDQSDGFKVPTINSIFENRAGELFASVNANKNGRFLSRFDGGKFVGGAKNLLESDKPSGWGWMQTVWQDGWGAWWIPSAEGLFRSPPATGFEQLPESVLQRIETGAKGKEIFRIFEDSRGDVWIATTGTTNELLRWERGRDTWHDHTQIGEIKLIQVVMGFVEDSWGNLWIGTGGGDDGMLIRYRDGKFKVFTEADGAPSGFTRDLFLDSTGKLWLATGDWGLLRLDDTNSDDLNFIHYKTSDGLSSSGVYCITEDEFGRIYAGTGRGLDRLNPETGQVENFTTADGLPASQVEVAYRDRTNTLWFATSGGLAHFKPEAERSRKPPVMLITGLRIAGYAQRISMMGESQIGELNLNSDQKQISVDFVGLGATLGEKLRYEYRFGNSDWTPTMERTVNFANLSSGEYQFEVRAVTADRITSKTPATVSFRIAAPFWQTPWFVVSLFALTAAAIYFFYRFRLKRLLELERVRTRIATDLHDDIGANLSKISLLSDVVNMQMPEANAESKWMLTTIAEVSRSSVGSMRDIVWAINPNRDSVLEMTRRMRQHAEETFVPNNISVKFNAPETGADAKLSMDVRRELFLIFKEAVNNAARHSGCQRVKIDFRVSGDEIILCIADDGRGFDIAEQSTGHGLMNMKTRAEKIGGKFEVSSEQGCGTIIEVQINN